MGKFIVFEGIDGSGLSTQTKLLKEWLKRRDEKVYVTKEPSKGIIGAQIKLVLEKRLSGMDNYTLALLFAADRMEHLKNEIAPKLEENYFVISDRYFFSNYAYQMEKREDLEWLKSINSKALPPNLTILLDVPPEICIERIKKTRSGTQLYETLEELERVRKNYYFVIKNEKNVEVVDGTLPIEEVAKKISKIVESYFLK